MTQSATLLLIALLLGLTAYIGAPAGIAFLRRHPESSLIYKLSPLSLLSFLLWLVLIAWAFTGQKDEAVISRYIARLRGKKRLPLAITLLVVLGLGGSLLPLLR